MSVMIVSPEALRQVREFLATSAFHPNGGTFVVNKKDEKMPSGVWDAVSGSNVRTTEAYKIYQIAGDFVSAMCFFNEEAYRLRYKTAESSNLALSIQYYQNYVEKKTKLSVGISQIYTTLKFIDYNSDIRDYLTEEEYEKYPHRVLFEKYQKKLNDVMLLLCRELADRYCKLENARWSY